MSRRARLDRQKAAPLNQTFATTHVAGLAPKNADHATAMDPSATDFMSAPSGAFYAAHDFGRMRIHAEGRVSAAPPTLARSIQRQPEAEEVAEDAPLTEATATVSPSGLERVQAAIAANDLDALIAIQHELRKQMQSTPMYPPQDARNGLATARHWTMDRIAAIRDTYEPLIAASSTGATLGIDATGPLEVIETLMDAECAPYLDALLEGDPQYRYEHFKNDVAEKVFAAVRLHSARRGVGRIGHRAEAEDEARKHGKLAKGPDGPAWCGAFAHTQAELAGGFDPYWAVHMQGEGGIRIALAYEGVMKQTWIWAFDHWEKLKEYHASRNSLRWYEAIFRAPPSRGIQPGDLVLIDNNYGENPDHITTAISFDGRFLTTVGGNQGTGNPADEEGVSRSKRPIDLQNNPDPNDVRQKDAKGNRINQTVDPSQGPKHVRVHGIGRWSMVDYERHIYRISASMPGAPPSTKELADLG